MPGGTTSTFFGMAPEIGPGWNEASTSAAAARNAASLGVAPVGSAPLLMTSTLYGSSPEPAAYAVPPPIATAPAATPTPAVAIPRMTERRSMPLVISAPK